MDFFGVIGPMPVRGPFTVSARAIAAAGFRCFAPATKTQELRHFLAGAVSSAVSPCFWALNPALGGPNAKRGTR